MLYGAGANGVRGYGFLYIYKQPGKHFFWKAYIRDKYFFHSLSCIIFTQDTIYADNKDKPMVGWKNQLIKKC